MNSSIKIEFRDDECDILRPIITVKVSTSDDPRDGLLKSFFKSLGDKSSLVYVSFENHTSWNDSESETLITLSPIKTRDLFSIENEIHKRLALNYTGRPINGNPLITMLEN